MLIMGERFARGEGLARLGEMAMVAISDRGEGLPFKIIVKLPDVRGRHHAHIFTLDSKRELGTFVITPNPPRDADDLVDYFAGSHRGLRDIPMEWRRMIVAWSRMGNRRCARRGISVSNWTAMLLEYDNNDERR